MKQLYKIYLKNNDEIFLRYIDNLYFKYVEDMKIYTYRKEYDKNKMQWREYEKKCDEFVFDIKYEF